MNFDKWFDRQSNVKKLIFCCTPLLGWIMNFLVRLSATRKKPTFINIVSTSLEAILAIGWFPLVIDIIWILMKDGQLFALQRITPEEEEARNQKMLEKRENAIKNLDRSKLSKYEELSDDALYDAMNNYKKFAITKLIACFIGWTVFCIGFVVGGWPLWVTGILILAAPSIAKSFGVLGGGGGLLSSMSTDIRTYDVYEDGHKVETTTVGDTIGSKILGLVFHVILVIIIGAVMTPLELIFDSLKCFKLMGAFHFKGARQALLWTDIGALIYAVAFLVIMIMIALSK